MNAYYICNRNGGGPRYIVPERNVHRAAESYLLMAAQYGKIDLTQGEPFDVEVRAYEDGDDDLVRTGPPALITVKVRICFDIVSNNT